MWVCGVIQLVCWEHVFLVLCCFLWAQIDVCINRAMDTLHFGCTRPVRGGLKCGTYGEIISCRAGDPAVTFEKLCSSQPGGGVARASSLGAPAVAKQTKPRQRLSAGSSAGVGTYTVKRTKHSDFGGHAARLLLEAHSFVRIFMGETPLLESVFYLVLVCTRYPILATTQYCTYWFKIYDQSGSRHERAEGRRLVQHLC